MMKPNWDFDTLRRRAMQNRNSIIDMIYSGGAGHPGGSLSIVDILTYLYDTDIDLSREERSRLVLSKGHAVPALYAVLYQQGILKDEDMKSFRCIDSPLQGHSCVTTIAQTDSSSGLLGQGLSIGVGMALAKRLKGQKENVYVVVGDGELQEGQLWEGMMSAGQYRLDNLYLIIDKNGLSSKGWVKDEMNLEPLDEKLRAFGWHVEEVDGHDFSQIHSCFSWLQTMKGRPKAIIADTVKGKGVSYMENNPKWHSSPLTEEEYAQAKRELGGMQ